ncbi:MAG: family N-acetyltransferase [Conexibacter sp.]|nr:family N-acetyltransferase [Conexibacter sp.]
MIRPAVREDARAIAELEVRAWRWAFVDIVEDADMPSVRAREARWTARPLEGAFVAQVDGRIVGVVRAGPDPDAADGQAGRLDGLYVDPAAQGAGVGTALYDHALAALRAAGFGAATLEVHAANGHARGFYERRGWSADGAAGEADGTAAVVRYRRTLGAMTIRPVKAGDVHAIAELQVRSWRAEYAGFVEESDMPTVADRIGLWNGVRPGEAWLAEQDGRIVGVVGVADGEIGMLHVDPPFQGGEVGSALLAHAEEVMRRAGHTMALLWTFRENAVSRARYERHGWSVDGAEQERSPGVSEIRYRRAL